MHRRIPRRKLLVTSALAFQVACVLLTGRRTMQATAFSGVSKRSKNVCHHLGRCLDKSSQRTNQRFGFNSVSILSSRRRVEPYFFTQTLRHFHKSSQLCMTSPSTEDEKQPVKKKVGGKKKKIKLRDEKDFDLEALASAFDEMARKEGFDDSSSLYADSETFEDEFDATDVENMEYEIDLDGKFDEEDDEDDDFLDFGGGDDDLSMEERIKLAQQDVNFGRVSVPKDMENFSKDVSAADLRKLGFKREINPFGKDETPRRETFQIITDAMKCPACGASFQTNDQTKPGFIPQNKFDIQQKLAKIENIQKIQEKAESDGEWSTEDEIDWLLQEAGGGGSDDEETDVDIAAVADEMGLDLVALTAKKVICKRCHGLQNFGEVPEELRPGWTEEPLLSQEKFRDLLLPLREKPAVIIAVVDLFDFSGSILPELDLIVGENPVILAANKADLLPSKMGQTRAESWVRRELDFLGVRSHLNIGGSVRLVSCKTGFGVSQLMSKARGIAEDMDCDVYIVGAANAGKSTLINHILAKNSAKSERFKGKKRAGNANARKGAVTASPLPGTTLEFIKIDIGGKNLWDTPGLLIPGTLTERLTPAELKMVVPKKQVEPITFRVPSGKCVLVGGLARIEVIGDCKPFMFTFFVSNDIKLHPTTSAKADEYVQKHAGQQLTPPLEPGPERIEQIGEFENHDVEIDGAGWKEAAADITLRGLGWVSVTGAGTAQVRISVPKGIGVSVRPPLMPFDVWEATAKYTGGRSVRKTTKTKNGKRNKGVGRR